MLPDEVPVLPEDELEDVPELDDELELDPELVEVVACF